MFLHIIWGDEAREKLQDRERNIAELMLREAQQERQANNCALFYSPYRIIPDYLTNSYIVKIEEIVRTNDGQFNLTTTVTALSKLPITYFTNSETSENKKPLVPIAGIQFPYNTLTREKMGGNESVSWVLPARDQDRKIIAPKRMDIALKQEENSHSITITHNDGNRQVEIFKSSWLKCIQLSTCQTIFLPCDSQEQAMFEMFEMRKLVLRNSLQKTLNGLSNKLPKEPTPRIRHHSKLFRRALEDSDRVEEEEEEEQNQRAQPLTLS